VIEMNGKFDRVRFEMIDVIDLYGGHGIEEEFLKKWFEHKNHGVDYDSVLKSIRVKRVGDMLFEDSD